MTFRNNFCNISMEYVSCGNQPVLVLDENKRSVEADVEFTSP